MVDVAAEDFGSHVVERLRFRLDDGTAVRGLLTRPATNVEPQPAILHVHAHGGRYDIGASELVDGRPALLDAPGPALAREGYVSLCIDMPVFGERSGTTESSAAKVALWHGRTLFGQMLAEQAAALTWLASRGDVDSRRIGMTGISMGATLAYFLAAIDPRVSAVAHLCCYADLATLIETGAHDLHGHYMTVPGLLAETSSGAIAGLVAPRPQLICVGLDDPLTPPLAVERAFAQTSAAYGPKGGLMLLTEEGIGHRETPTMRSAVLDFFRQHL
ncbi:alpha/beta hydrolase family protein [Aminobacter aganoensis]|uniref:Dienelactone hydrolase n=1 Tax=Aminobacter aganoensis TaxID=83264 RepID=A0A7X0FB55_9HYPH|nr:dienelactone hydrolase [Aminobacter aganoensis]